MTREEMMDTVIRKFGFEDSRTINFCKLAETYPEETVYKAFKALVH